MNFDVQEGEVFGFLGPSGAGKTTTQRLIIGLLRNYHGKIEVLGKERNQVGQRLLRAHWCCFRFPKPVHQANSQRKPCSSLVHTIKMSVKILINCWNALACCQKKMCVWKASQRDEDAFKLYKVHYAQSQADVF
jgi:ABC-type oligopeptide transport system ATPase subunit